jgi:hypothetical protein
MDPKTNQTAAEVIDFNSVENADNPLHGIADAVAFTINQNVSFQRILEFRIMNLRRHPLSLLQTTLLSSLTFCDLLF